MDEENYFLSLYGSDSITFNLRNFLSTNSTLVSSTLVAHRRTSDYSIKIKVTGQERGVKEKGIVRNLR